MMELTQAKHNVLCFMHEDIEFKKKDGEKDH